jgi:hypothetical protein
MFEITFYNKFKYVFFLYIVVSVFDLNIGIEENDGRKADLNSIRNGIPFKSKLLCRRKPLDKILYDHRMKRNVHS